CALPIAKICLPTKTETKSFLFLPLNVESILAKGDRVEMIPVRDGVKIIHIKRREVKLCDKFYTLYTAFGFGSRKFLDLESCGQSILSILIPPLNVDSIFAKDDRVEL